MEGFELTLTQELLTDGARWVEGSDFLGVVQELVIRAIETRARSSTDEQRRRGVFLS